MCGLVGLALPPGDAFDVEVLERLGVMQRHRGPDDTGYLTWSGEGSPVVARRPEGPRARVGIAHQRLAVIDPTEAGWQPMTSVDGSTVVAFNGEIYNYVELRQQLQARGHAFKSESDTEVLVRGLTEWGLRVLDRVVGMFAVAIVDLRARQLHLVRDPFGIKPMHVARWRGGFAFASEIKTLRTLDGVGRRGDPQAVADYLVHGSVDHGTSTFFDGIDRVPAGSVWTLALDDPRTPRTRRYWTFTPEARLDIGRTEAAQELRAIFLENVALHLRSDRAVATALSGGVDSSSVLSAARAVGPDDLDLQAVTFVAAGSELNEEQWADRVAEAFGARLHKVIITPEELAADLDDLLATQDEPFASTSIYAQYRVFRAARDAGITVMLDGQGADEVLAGYPHYAFTRLTSLLAEHRWSDVLRIQRQLRRAVPGFGRIAGGRVRDLLPAPVAKAVQTVGIGATTPWLRQDWFDARGVGPSGRRIPSRLRNHLLSDALDGNLPSLLRYEDRNSMRFSIESRVPFLTPKLVEFTLSLPEELLVADDGTGKQIFRDAMRGLTPDAVLDRRDKIGFATPEATWLRALRPAVDGMLARVQADAVPMLSLPHVRAEWNALTTDGGRRRGVHVWRLLNLVAWAERGGVAW